ncbi:MAG: hypothetical protein KF861_21995 [Planctomycetaceae bacterium]|nr:hypothetical protein [Planctomycetaceae bacterium]
MHATSRLPKALLYWRPGAAIVLWTVTTSCAGVLVARALSGAFDNRVTAVVPSAATALAAIASLSAWVLSRQSSGWQPENTAGRLGIGLLSLAPPALVAWSTTVSASPVAAGTVLGILVLGLTFVVVCEGVAASTVNATDVAAEYLPMDGVGPLESIEDLEADDIEASELAESEPPAFQRIARYRESDGIERIDAVLHATFAPGERETALHLPIHPVLSGDPQVTCLPLDGSGITAAAAVAHRYGIRIEVKRSGDIRRGDSVPIGIEIRCEALSCRVA